MSDALVCLSCGPESRSAENLVSCIDQFQDQLKHDWAAHDGKTYCNQFVHAVCEALQVPLPKDLLANEQFAYLNNPHNGWARIDEPVARGRAFLGLPVLACWPNPAAGGHGHIAVLKPAPSYDGVVQDGTWIAQAGADNFLMGRLARGFGRLPVVFFTHD